MSFQISVFTTRNTTMLRSCRRCVVPCGISSHHHINSNILQQQQQQQRYLSLRAKHRARIKKAQELSYAPASIAAIADGPLEGYNLLELNKRNNKDKKKIPGAAVRSVGCTRRVFLLEPYLTPDELEGLAYRVRALSKNSAINSVLISTLCHEHDNLHNPHFENIFCPTSVGEAETAFQSYQDETHDLFDPVPGHTWHVASGYDPIQITKSGLTKDAAKVDSLLESIKQLALATRGGGEKDFYDEVDYNNRPKVPVITVPHGIVQDGGYALCLSSYCIATNQTSFRILHPTRGLSLDPVGFSYFLPRLGEQYQQPCQEYPVGMLLALTGIAANANDMLETGLATHTMKGPSTLGLLERTLADLPPYAQQQYVENPRRYEGIDYSDAEDHQEPFRGLAVANMIHACTNNRADGTNMWSTQYDTEDVALPAYLDCHPTPWHEDRISEIVNFAATLEDILNKPSVPEIMEGLKQVVAEGKSANKEEQEGIDLCRDLVERMERASPLALCVTHRLLRMGAAGDQTLESCMDREKRVQAKLFTMDDYQNWVQHQMKYGGIIMGQMQKKNNEETSHFNNWKHKSVAHVSEDEILEVIGETMEEEKS